MSVRLGFIVESEMEMLAPGRREFPSDFAPDEPPSKLFLSIDSIRIIALEYS
jgi:hypothetical protein